LIAPASHQTSPESASGSISLEGGVGRRGIDQLLAIVADESDARVAADARLCLAMLAAQLIVVKQQILENDRRVRASAHATDLGRRLMDIPGVGPLLASFEADLLSQGSFDAAMAGCAVVHHVASPFIPA
jgi:transposase